MIVHKNRGRGAIRGIMHNFRPKRSGHMGRSGCAFYCAALCKVNSAQLSICESNRSVLLLSSLKKVVHNAKCTTMHNDLNNALNPVDTRVGRYNC